MQTVLFDVDGVLVHGYHARAEYRKCWDKDIDRDFGIKQDRFKNEFIFGPFMNEVIVGKMGLKESLEAFLPGLGFNGDPQDFIDYWLKNDSNVNYELFEYIQTLKNSGKVRLFVATNQEHCRAKHLMENLGFNSYFEDIFYSARLGVMKPHPDYFSKIEKLLGVEDGSKPIFFDDTPDVIEGARQAGWEAVEFVHADDIKKSKFIKDLLAPYGSCIEAGTPHDIRRPV